MKQFQVRRVAVVDLNGYCVGIISQGDLALKVSKPQEIFETLREVSKPKKLMTV
jgi:CBS domain-containing protein